MGITVGTGTGAGDILRIVAFQKILRNFCQIQFLCIQDVALNGQWYLIKKDVFEESRAVMPGDLTERGLNFPPAILCGYTFFAYYYARNQYLWWHDFVWCCDTDHNGDRIYVGKYHDVDGVNKNGFSIHRHLALRPCYGSVNYIG